MTLSHKTPAAGLLLACWLQAIIGCNGPIFSGSTAKKAEDDAAPQAAVAALLGLHPDAHVDWIDRVASNAPTFYRLHYHQNNASNSQAPPPGEFLYSDCMLAGMQVYPDRIRDAFKILHPDATVDKVEEFEDVGRQPAWYRLHYRIGTVAIQKAYFNPDGDPLPADPGRG